MKTLKEVVEILVEERTTLAKKIEALKKGEIEKGLILKGQLIMLKTLTEKLTK